MKRYRKYLICVVVLILAALYSYRVYMVNARAERIPCQVYEMGETVPLGNNICFTYPMDGYSVKVLAADVLTNDEFLEKYDGKKENFPAYDMMQQIYDIELEISNEDNTDTGIDLYGWYIQKDAALASFDAVYYREANKDKGYVDTAIAVRPHTSVTLHAVFPLPKLNFKKRDYRDPERMDMDLVVTLYPEKKVIRLQ